MNISCPAPEPEICAQEGTKCQGLEMVRHRTWLLSQLLSAAVTPSSTSSTSEPPTSASSPTSSAVRHFFLWPREGGVVTVTSRYSIFFLDQTANSNKQYI